MSQLTKVLYFFVVASLLASPTLWGANIAWVGGDPSGVHDVSIAANWDPSAPAERNSWFINTNNTGNYPIFDGNSVSEITIWDIMVGRADNWGMDHPLTGPGYFEQSGGTLIVDATFQLGQGNAGLMSTYVFSGGAINKAALGDAKVGTEGATAQMIMSNGAQFNQAGWSFYVGDGGGSVGTLKMSDNANLTNANGNFHVGQYGAQGTVTMSDYATINVSGDFHVGRDNDSTGSLTMTGSARIDAGGEFDIGAWGGTGQMTIGPGNTFTAKGWSSVGNNGNANTRVSSVGTLTTSGTINHTGPISIGRCGANGVWNQVGGSTSLFDRIFLGGNMEGPFATSTAVLNISNGGLISLRQIVPWDNAGSAGYTSTINADKGTLQVQYDTEDSAENFIASKGSSAFNVYLMAGGLTIDTSGGKAAIRVPLQNGATQPGGTSGGGLTVTGGGELTLRGANTYTGPTVVKYGVLRVPGATTLATTGISVEGGSALDLGRQSSVGPLTSLELKNNSTWTLRLDTPDTSAITTSSMVNTDGINLVVDATGPALTAGTYTIVKGFSNGAQATIPVISTMRAYSATANVTPTTVDIVLTNTGVQAANIQWTAALNTIWSVSPTENWANAPIPAYPDPTVPNNFYNLDHVSFVDNDPNYVISPDSFGVFRVIVEGTVHPASINIVASNTANPWFFQGTGAITGDGTTVTKSGSGVATFRNAGGVYYTGLTTLSGGTLNFSCGDVALPGGIKLDGGALGVSNDFGATTVTVTGNLTGTAANGLTKTGNGTLILKGTSAYSGPTVLRDRGIVQIDSLAQLGTSTDDPANLVLHGMLHYTGTEPVLTRGFTSGDDDGGLWIDHDISWSNVAAKTANNAAFTKLGAGTWTINQNPTSTPNEFGHIRLQQGLTVIHGATLNVNDLWLGNMASADLTMDGGASLHSNANINMAAADNNSTGNATITLDNASMAANGWVAIGTTNNTCHGTLVMSNGSTLSGGDGWTSVSIGENAYGDVTLNDSSAITAVGRIRIACGGGNGHAIVRMHGTSSITTGNPGYEAFALGRDGAGSNGLLTMDGHNTAFDRLSGSHITSGGPFDVGCWWGATGEVNMSGASYIVSNGSATFGFRRSTGKLTMSDVTDFVTHGDFYLSGDGSTGTLIMKDAAHLTADYGMGIARYGWDNVAPTADIQMSGATELHGGSWFNLGAFANAQGNLTMTGSAWFDLGTAHTDQWSNFGLESGNATIDMSQTARMTVANKGISLGERNGSVGSITLHDGASIEVASSRPTRESGTDSEWDNGGFMIGKEGGTGTVVLLDGSSIVGTGTNIQVGYSYNDWIKPQPPFSFGTGTVNVVGSNARVSTTGAGQIIIGSVGGIGIWFQKNGTTTTPNPVILGEYDIKHQMHPDWGVASWGMGSLYLQGGVFEAPQITTHSNAGITTGTTSGTIYFQGGTLRASADSGDFITSDGNGSTMTLLVGQGAGGLGAVLDTQAFSVTIDETLAHDAAGPAIDGGLMKLGAGELTLTADPTYTGATTVNAGILNVGHLNTPSATVYVATGATLNAASLVADTLTIGGTPLSVATAGSASAVPEPGVLTLLALAGMGVLLAAWRRK